MNVRQSDNCDVIHMVSSADQKQKVDQDQAPVLLILETEVIIVSLQTMETDVKAEQNLHWMFV